MPPPPDDERVAGRRTGHAARRAIVAGSGNVSGSRNTSTSPRAVGDPEVAGRTRAAAPIRLVQQLHGEREVGRGRWRGLGGPVVDDDDLAPGRDELGLRQRPVHPLQRQALLEVRDDHRHVHVVGERGRTIVGDEVPAVLRHPRVTPDGQHLGSGGPRRHRAATSRRYSARCPAATVDVRSGSGMTPACHVEPGSAKAPRIARRSALGDPGGYSVR